MTKKKTNVRSKERTTKEYSSNQVKAAHIIRKTTGHSIRRIAKDMKIPKSVIGRWIKEDEKIYVRKYDFRDVKRKVKKNLSQKDYETFSKMEHRILHAPISEQSELTIEYYDDDEDGYYSVISG